MDNGASSYHRFLNGDDSAFDDIINELFDNLVFFINRYVHDLHAAEDIAIDSFTELIVNKKRYNFKTSLKTYLFVIGRSRALNYIRHRNVLRFSELNELIVSDDQQYLEAKILSDQLKKLVHSALQELPQDMRLAVHLIYFEDMSYKQAAKVLGKSEKQIDNLLYRAKARLRTILGKDGEQYL